MAISSWATTWARKTLQEIGLEPTTYAIKALRLWQKSTPLQPWTYNPLGIPKKGYAPKAVPGTQYALFHSYSEFNSALGKALGTERQGRISLLLKAADNTTALWREINALPWPAAQSESDWPVLLHGMARQELQALGLDLPVSPQRTTGTTGIMTGNNHHVLQAQRAMVTAAQTKMQLADAIRLITTKR